MEKECIDENRIQSAIYRVYTSLGLTRDEFARSLGVDRITVLRWENGKRQPRLNPQQMIILDNHLRALGMRISDLPPDWSKNR